VYLDVGEPHPVLVNGCHEAGVQVSGGNHRHDAQGGTHYRHQADVAPVTRLLTPQWSAAEYTLRSILILFFYKQCSHLM